MDCIPLIQLFLGVFGQFRQFGKFLGEKGEIDSRGAEVCRLVQFNSKLTQGRAGTKNLIRIFNAET
jgi:hypothetical protein